MEKSSDTYRTIIKPSEEILYKEKNSKFFGQAFPITSEDAVKHILDDLADKHTNSNHICYAWQLGVDQIRYRANDDGEPNNSAGMPIYGQLQSFEVTNILVTVTRYFGGTKLGVGGLISAYRTAAKMALEVSQIKQRRIETVFELQFPYSEMGKVMRILKQQSIPITNQKLDLDCTIEIKVPKSKGENTIGLFKSYEKIELLKKD